MQEIPSWLGAVAIVLISIGVIGFTYTAYRASKEPSWYRCIGCGYEYSDTGSCQPTPADGSNVKDLCLCVKCARKLSYRL